LSLATIRAAAAATTTVREDAAQAEREWRKPVFSWPQCLPAVVRSWQ